MKKKQNKKLFKEYFLEDFSNSKEVFLDFLYSEFEYNNKKLFKTKFYFIMLNLIMFMMSTIIVILTLIIIGKKIGGEQIRHIFVTISIISACITFCTSVGSLFQFKDRKKFYFEQNERIQTYINNLEDNNINIDDKVQEISNYLFSNEEN